MQTQSLRRLYLKQFEDNSKLSAIAFRRAIRKDVQKLKPQKLSDLNYLKHTNLEDSLISRFEKNGIKYGNTIYNDLRLNSTKKKFNPTFSSSWARFVRTNYATQLSSKITLLQGTIVSEVSRLVNIQLSTGDTIDSLADAIQKVVASNDFYFWQAERIARTEVGSAMNQATEVAVTELGIEVQKRWVSGGDSRERDSHRLANGEVREKNEAFSNGLMYPHDPNGDADEVINCRCVLQYIPKN